jgi:hypothetical protein
MAMTDTQLNKFVSDAEEIYSSRLRAILEPGEIDRFVAIEPESGDYFLGDTLSEAMGAARRCHPTRLAHAMRVGHAAAIHFGMHVL